MRFTVSKVFIVVINAIYFTDHLSLLWSYTTEPTTDNEIISIIAPSIN